MAKNAKFRKSGKLKLSKREVQTRKVRKRFFKRGKSSRRPQKSKRVKRLNDVNKQRTSVSILLFLIRIEIVDQILLEKVNGKL